LYESRSADPLPPDTDNIADNINTGLTRQEAGATWAYLNRQSDVEQKFSSDDSAAIHKLAAVFVEKHQPLTHTREDVVRAVLAEVLNAIRLITRESFLVFKQALCQLSTPKPFRGDETVPFVLQLRHDPEKMARWLSNVVETILVADVLQALEGGCLVSEIGVNCVNPKAEVKKFISESYLNSFGYLAESPIPGAPPRKRARIGTTVTEPVLELFPNGEIREHHIVKSTNEKTYVVSMGRDGYLFAINSTARHAEDSLQHLNPPTIAKLIWPALLTGLWCSRRPIAVPPSAALDALVAFHPSAHEDFLTKGKQTPAARKLQAVIQQSLGDKSKGASDLDNESEEWNAKTRLSAARTLRKQCEAAYLAYSHVSAWTGLGSFLEPSLSRSIQVMPHVSKCQTRGQMVAAQRRRVWALCNFAVDSLTVELRRAARELFQQHNPGRSYADVSRREGLRVFLDAADFFEDVIGPALYELSCALGEAWSFRNSVTVIQSFAVENWAGAALEVLFKFLKHNKVCTGFLPLKAKLVWKEMGKTRCSSRCSQLEPCCRALHRTEPKRCSHAKDRKAPCCWKGQPGFFIEMEQRLRRICYYELQERKAKPKPEDTNLEWIVDSNKTGDGAKRLREDVDFILRLAAIVGRLPPLRGEDHFEAINILFEEDACHTQRYLKQLIQLTVHANPPGTVVDVSKVPFDAKDEEIIGLLGQNKFPDVVSLVMHRFYSKLEMDAELIVCILRENVQSERVVEFFEFYDSLNDTRHDSPRLAMYFFLLRPVRELAMRLKQTASPYRPSFVAQEILDKIIALTTVRADNPFDRDYVFSDPPW